MPDRELTPDEINLNTLNINDPGECVCGQEDEPRELIIAGAEDVIDPPNDENNIVVQPGKAISEMSLQEQKALADKMVQEIDDHENGIPMIPLNLSKMTFWSFENAMIPGDMPDDDRQPAVIITFASADDPRGTPHILTRDRALKFASQLKKWANRGPSLQQRAAESGLLVPPSADQELIVPS